MDTNTAIGRMIMGLGIKLIGAGMALWIGYSAYTFVSATFAQTSAALEQVQNAGR
jgi:hypothetical protein